MLYEISYKSCVSCDRCAQACPWYPVYKPSQRIEGLLEAVETCTMCGRCVLKCPIKVPVHKRSYKLKVNGYINKELIEIRKKVEEIGQSFGVSGRWVELAREWGYPIDEEARWLFVPSAFDSLPTSELDYKAELWLLERLGYDFTLSSGVPEGFGNFIFDLSDPSYFKKKAMRLLKVAKELGVKGLILGECGADYKVWPRLHMFIGVKHDLKVLTFPEALARRISEIIPVRKLEGVVSYHDPCGLSRYNFVTEEPRLVIKKIAEKYVERKPSGKMQMCCGGGGGVSFSNELKRKAIDIVGPKKVEQFKGTDLVLTACAKCKSMLLTYSLLLGGDFKVHRLSYAVAWSMGLDLPQP